MVKIRSDIADFVFLVGGGWVCKVIFMSSQLRLSWSCDNKIILFYIVRMVGQNKNIITFNSYVKHLYTNKLRGQGKTSVCHKVRMFVHFKSQNPELAHFRKLNSSVPLLMTNYFLSLKQGKNMLGLRCAKLSTIKLLASFYCSYLL